MKIKTVFILCSLLLALNGCRTQKEFIRDVRIDSTYTKNSQMILDKIGTLEVGFQKVESRITETENQIAEQLNEQLDFTRSFYDANGNITMQETGTSNRAKNIEQRQQSRQPYKPT